MSGKRLWIRAGTLLLAAAAVLAPRADAGPREAAPAVRLAFLRGGDVYVLDPARGGAAPWWSADGRTLFFRRSAPATPPGMWRWRADTGLRPAGGSKIRDEWSPDGEVAAVMEPPTARWQPGPGWMETRVWLERDGEHRR